MPHAILKDAIEKTRENARHEMSHLIRSGELQQLRRRTMLEEGDVADVLLRLVREHTIDLLVIGTRGHRGVKRMLLGSVAEKVFRQAPCPVLIVPPRARQQVRITRILYPTNFSQRSLQAMPYAISLARHFRAKLILLHVVEGVAIHSVAELNRQRKLVENRLRKSVSGKVELELKPELAVEFGGTGAKNSESRGGMAGRFDRVGSSAGKTRDRPPERRDSLRSGPSGTLPCAYHSSPPCVTM